LVEGTGHYLNREGHLIGVLLELLKTHCGRQALRPGYGPADDNDRIGWSKLSAQRLGWLLQVDVHLSSESSRSGSSRIDFQSACQ
jgi:hypothetical protein